MEMFAVVVGFVSGRLVERYLSRVAHDRAVEVAYVTGHVDGWRKAEEDVERLA